MDVITAVQDFIVMSNELKETYRNFISDKTVPLEDRWILFKIAPHDWKEHSRWVEYFSFEKLLPEKEINWYDDFGYERCQSVDMYILIEDYFSDFVEDLPNKEEIITTAKEEILSKNIGSFIFDW